jgi:hypothetical protein
MEIYSDNVFYASNCAAKTINDEIRSILGEHRIPIDTTELEKSMKIPELENS